VDCDDAIIQSFIEDMLNENRIYFDYNASAPLLPGARAVMLETLAMCGNASSIHGEGRRLRRIVEDARESVAAVFGCGAKQVIFTSGATEAAMLALSPSISRGSQRVDFSRLYVSAVEHPCVLSGGRFPARDITVAPVLESGLLDLEALAALLDAHASGSGAPLVAVMLANNETGIIQPIAEIADLVHRYGGMLVVDAAQAPGRMAVSLSGLGADFLIVSAHKMGGPQGAGALLLGNEATAPSPMLTGGGQEGLRRAGTENVAALAGFGAAAAAHNGCELAEIKSLRDSLEEGILTISVQSQGRDGQPVLFGRGEKRLVNTTCFAAPGIAAETALIALDLEGIAVSSGSACSSGKVRRSHVLSAMGVPDDLARCALRISLGVGNGRRDVDRFLDAWRSVVSAAASHGVAVAV
jgi:cysteine desulfurase